MATAADLPAAAPAGSGGASTEELLRRARSKHLLADLQDFQEAAALYLEAGERSPDDPRVDAALAETYSYWGSRREAGGLESASFHELSHERACRAVSAAPNLPEAHRAMAVALRMGRKSDPVLRVKEAALALELNPYDGDNCYEYWRATGHVPDDPLIDRALVLNPRHCGAYNALGVAWAGRGRFDDAVYCLEKTLAINPRHAMAHYNLALALLELGRPRRARDVMRRAERLHPGDQLVLRGLRIVFGKNPKEDTPP